MPSSSSSSLRSLSTSSLDSSLIFTIPTTHETTPSSLNDARQPMQAFSQIRTNVSLHTLDSENDAMTRAIFAVLTSSSPSSSSMIFRNQNLPHNYQINPKASAFKRYSTTTPLGSPTTIPATARAQTMMKGAIMFYRKFNLARREYLQRSRPTTTTTTTTNQLHHMMSERKRREKLNESFIALRSLLPSGTKRSKASVLTTAREYLASLKGRR